MRAISKVLAGTAALALVGIGVPAAMADTSVGPDAVLVDTAPLAPIALTIGNRTPGAYGLDMDGDHFADGFGYGLDPNASVNPGVTAGTQTLGAYDSTSRTFTDAGRLRWVATHGYGAVDPRTLAQQSGAQISLIRGSTDFAMLQSATQAAIWRFSTGAQVSSTFRYGATSLDNTNFWRVYNYLVNSAVSMSAQVLVYDEQPGQAQTQAIVLVTSPDMLPTPVTPVTPSPTPTQISTPTPTVTPTQTPTQTAAPTPTPTATQTPTPTSTTNAPWTPGPDAVRVSTSTFYRITMSNNAYTPVYAGFDTTGDRVADFTGFSIEPTTSTTVPGSTQKLAAYDSVTRTDFKDGGRLRWVATHGLGAVSGPELAAKAGVSVTMASGSTDPLMLQSATQAAIWRFSSGLVVNPNWRFGYTTADNQKFWAVYTYLVNNAVPVDTKVAVYDSKPGEPATMGYVRMTPAG